MVQLLAGKGLTATPPHADLEQLEHIKNLAGIYQGKSEYLAPEVVRGEEGDIRSDVYALGILLFELLSGQPPFTGTTYEHIARKHVLEPLPSLHEQCSDIPISIELVVNRALHRDPQQRFRSPRELYDTFINVLNKRVFVPTHIPLLETIHKLQPALSPAPSLLSIAAPHVAQVTLATRDTMTAPAEAREDVLPSSEKAAHYQPEDESETEQQHTITVLSSPPVHENSPDMSIQAMITQIQQQSERLEAYYNAIPGNEPAVPPRKLALSGPRPRIKDTTPSAHSDIRISNKNEKV